MIEFAVNIRFHAVADGPFAFVLNGLGMDILHAVNGADHLGRNAGYQGVRRNLGTSQNYGTGSYDGASADNCAVKDGGMHADEYMVFNGAGMNHSAVADGDIVPDDAGMVVCYMKAAEVLHVGAFAYGNVVYIAPCYDARPDAGIFANSDITGQKGVGSYKSIGINLRNFSIKFYSR